MIELLATAAATFAAATGGPVDPGGPVPPVSGGWRERQIEWALAGVGRHGRTLIVQPGIWGGCDQGPPTVRVTEAAGGIAIEAVVLEPEGVEAMICPAIAGLSEPQRVALDAPVDGRPVRGPHRTTAPGSTLPQVPELEPTMPRVVGLSARDARAALCGTLVRARGAKGGAVVTRQSVQPGTPLDLAAERPERCRDLPAKPAVRLHAAR